MIGAFGNSTRGRGGSASGGAPFPEAPADGGYYARRNGGWAPAFTRGLYLDQVGLVEGFGDVEHSRRNSAALNAALATYAPLGIELWPRPGASYWMGGKVSLPTNARLVQHNGLQAEFIMDTKHFTNQSLLLASRYGDTSCLFQAIQTQPSANPPKKGIVLGGFTVRPDALSARCLRPVHVQYCDNPQILPLECFGMGMGVFLTLSSLVNGADIYEPYGHDFYENSLIFDPTHAPQMTFLEIDNDIAPSKPSEGIRIHRPKWKHIIFGPEAIAYYYNRAAGPGPGLGDQTDGINIARSSTRGTVIVDAYGEDVAEHIDCFGSETQILGGVFKNAHNVAMKFLYGASNCLIVAPSVVGFGLHGINFAGSTEVATRVARNQLVAPMISGGGYNGTFDDADSSCVHISNNGNPAAQAPKDNLIRGGVLQQDRAKYGYLDTAVGGEGNIALDALIIPGTRSERRVKVLATPAGTEPTAASRPEGGVRLVGSNLFSYDVI